jgi:radical SAM superfamily enzyme YgiQ (UPF0313 family)
VKVTLIEPAMIRAPTFREKRSWQLPPLTLATLAGLTPPGIEVEALDDRLEEIDYDAPRDLVGLSLKTYTARRGYEIAAEFRRRGVPVVLGGHHPTLRPDEALRHADAVVVGEAEGVWARLLADAARGRLQARYRHEGRLSFEGVRPDHRVLAGRRYLPVGMIETTRGCPFACSFCSVTTFFGRSFRHRPPAEVVAEIERLDKPLYFFVDDNIVADREAAKALCRAIEPLGIRWVSQASLTMARDRELLRLMRASGCMGVLAGIESISAAGLAQIDKRWNTVGIGYDEALAALRDHGIAVVGSFVLGLDDDTPETLERTLEFAERQRLFAVLFNILTPYPGTALYDELARSGRLEIPEWWLDPRYTYGRMVFEPASMPAAEVEATRRAMYRRFYRPRSLFLRLLDHRANARDPWQVLAFLGLNLPAEREEALRAGLPLGSSG